jgi:hypothetical protein
MVKQVVGSGQRCAPSTSPVCRCSWAVPAVLQVDAACQRRDVAAALAAPAATTALAGVAAEKGSEGLEKGLASGIGQLFLARWWEGLGGLGRTRALSRPTQTQTKCAPRMGRARRIGSDASHHWGGRRPCAGPVRPVRMRADAMRRPAGDA